MSSRASTGVERKIEHALFLLSVWIKGLAGLLETIGGFLLIFIPHTRLNALVVFLTAPELTEDPTDLIATFSSASFTNFPQTQNYSPAAT